jgi:PIN domain nuclease of toxin-antitoxin system
LCQDQENELFLSVASVWEMQIKLQLGKLKLDRSLGTLIDRQKDLNGLELINVTLKHVLELSMLPSIHRDPFDRLLIAQSNVEKIKLVTTDSLILKYPVQWVS